MENVPRLRPSARIDAQQVQRQLDALGHELAVVRPQQHVEVDVAERRRDLVVDDPHHLLGRDAVGGQRGDERAGARADVDVELVDRAVDREQVERAQGADLVDGAGEAAAAEDQRGLRLARAPARLAPGRGAPRALPRRGIQLHDIAHAGPSLGNDPVGKASSDFSRRRGFRTLGASLDGPDRRSRLPAGRAPARRRLRGGAGRDRPGAGRADAPRGRGVGRAGGRSRHGRARSTPCAPGRRGCPPRWRSSTRRPPRCGGWAPRRGCRPRCWRTPTRTPTASSTATSTCAATATRRSPRAA